MFLKNNYYCDICHQRIALSEEKKSFGGPNLDYHKSCLNGLRIKPNKNLLLITEIKTEPPKITLAPFEEEMLSKKDPIQAPCYICGKPIAILEEKYVALRQEFGGNYDGFQIRNYHAACLSDQTKTAIYEHSDANRHWFIFINKAKVNIAKK